MGGKKGVEPKPGVWKKCKLEKKKGRLRKEKERKKNACRKHGFFTKVMRRHEVK